MKKDVLRKETGLTQDAPKSFEILTGIFLVVGLFVLGLGAVLNSGMNVAIGVVLLVFSGIFSLFVDY